MLRICSAIAAIICLTIGGLVAATLIPAAPVTRVRTIEPAAIVKPARKYYSSRLTPTTIDWRPGARYAAATVDRDAAIRYAVAHFANEARQRSMLISHHHAPSVPARPAWQPSWGSDRWYCPQWSSLTLSIWGAKAHWADAVMGAPNAHSAAGESGCRIDAWGGGAFGLMQLQGHAVAYIEAAGILGRPCAIGYADAACEIQAARQWCNYQPNAWSFHGSCR